MSLRKAVGLFIDVFDHNDVMTNSTVTNALNELRQAYAEPYVPMTNAEYYAIWAKTNSGYMPSDDWNQDFMWEDERKIEAAVLARLGIEVKDA